MKRVTIIALIVVVVLLGALALFLYQRKTWVDSVDIAYYINLDHREDRNKDVLGELDSVGFPRDKVVRISAAYEKDRGHIGCSKSHIKTVEQFIKSGHNTCMILEDDFKFTNDPSVIDVFTKIPFDVIMLSANVLVDEPSEHKGLRKVSNSQTSGGYLLTREYAPRLLQNLKDGLVELVKEYDHQWYALDQYWKRLQVTDNWYVADPKLGVQRESYSDIEKGVVDYGV